MRKKERARLTSGHFLEGIKREPVPTPPAILHEGLHLLNRTLDQLRQRIQILGDLWPNRLLHPVFLELKDLERHLSPISDRHLPDRSFHFFNSHVNNSSAVHPSP